jgi:hypothetical protein
MGEVERMADDTVRVVLAQARVTLSTAFLRTSPVRGTISGALTRIVRQGRYDRSIWGKPNPLTLFAGHAGRAAAGCISDKENV